MKRYRAFINESSNSSLDAILKSAGDKGIKLAVSETDERLVLSKIVVPEDKRDAGLGSEFMKELVSYADRVKKQIALTPSADFGGSVSKLKKFYGRFGFVDNKGSNKDFGTRETMIREPK